MIFQVFNSRIQKHGSFEDLFLELAKQAKYNGKELTFVFPGVETPEVKKKMESYTNAEVRIITENWRSISFIRSFLMLALNKRLAIADFHFCSSLNFIFIFIALRILRKRIIYHYHGEISPIENLRFYNKHFSKLRLLTFFVDKIVCVSEANARFLRELNIKREIVVIYNGIKLEPFLNYNGKTDFKKRSGLNNGELLIVSIGSLIPRKGIDIIIKAAQLVTAEIPETRFFIVGGGDREKYQTLVDNLGLSDNIRLTGLLKEYPYDILAASDLYVSASYAESFGLSIAEAQAMGKPIVATRVGGVPEVVREGETGILVESGNVKQLANGILTLLRNNGLRKEFGNAGREWVIKQFNLKDKVEELLDVCFI